MQDILSQPEVGPVVLISHSMGGGIVAKFLYESSLAGSVAGVILDSPVIDFNSPVDQGERSAQFARFRLNVTQMDINAPEWAGLEAMDYLKDAGRFNVPIPLILGADDTRVPVETSDELAQLSPDLVT